MPSDFGWLTGAMAGMGWGSQGNLRCGYFGGIARAKVGVGQSGQRVPWSPGSFKTYAI